MGFDAQVRLTQLLENGTGFVCTDYHVHLLDAVFSDEGLLESEQLGASWVLQAIQANQMRTTPQQFHSSLAASKHPDMLTHYSVDELAQMKLFKVPGYNIGYALKKWKNGSFSEIVAVHNNEPSIKGIGEPLMRQAVHNGGCYLDHFDGFLSGLYSKLGFVEYARDEFDARYDPDGSFSKKYGPAAVIYRVHKNCQRLR